MCSLDPPEAGVCDGGSPVVVVRGTDSPAGTSSTGTDPAGTSPTGTSPTGTSLTGVELDGVELDGSPAFGGGCGPSEAGVAGGVSATVDASCGPPAMPDPEPFPV
jgi:hypothetical protein